MTCQRRLATLTLVALFAAFQLLAPAPVLHAHCGVLGGAPAVRTADGPGPVVKAHAIVSRSSPGGCPACTISGLGAVLAARLAVRAPFVEIEPASSPWSASPPAPYLEDLRGRAPPDA